MNTDEHGWIRMNTDGYGWTRMDTDGHGWTRISFAERGCPAAATSPSQNAFTICGDILKHSNLLRLGTAALRSWLCSIRVHPCSSVVKIGKQTFYSSLFGVFVVQPKSAKKYRGWIEKMIENALPTCRAGRKSRKRPALVVGRKPNGKSRLLERSYSCQFCRCESH
jgi:hypothetical protein